MTAQSEPDITSRGTASESLGQTQPEEAVLSTLDPCSRELEQLEADAKKGQNSAKAASAASLMSQEKSVQRRGTTTQTIPTRYVRSPRRLLEVLKIKYGEDGYTVEMRHNVYTVVTRDGKGKLSEASLAELRWP